MDTLSRVQSDLSSALGSHSLVMAEIEVSRNNYEAVSVKNTRTTASHGKEVISGLRLKDVKRTVESSLPDIVSPFVTSDNIVNIEPNNADSVVKAEAYTALINRRFSEGIDKSSLLESIARVLMVDGTVFTKVGWDDEAIVELIMNEELIVDPSARSLKDAQFVIQRRKVTIQSILDNTEWYGEHTMEELAPLAPSTSTQFDKPTNTNGYDSSFNFEDRARQLVETFEYYGVLDIGNGLEPVLVIWSDDILLRETVSPYPSKWNGIPFESAVYTRIPHSIYGESLPHLLSDYQQIRDACIRGIITNMSKSTNGQLGIKKGALDVTNRKRLLNGDNFEFNTAPTDIWEGSFNEIPQSVFMVMEQMKTESEELSGISRMNAGVDARALNSTALGASLVNDNAQKRIIQVSRHIGEMLERVFSKWIDLYEMMGDEITIPVGRGMFETIPAYMLAGGSFNVSMVAGTAGLDQQRMNSLQMMYQSLTGSGQQIPSDVYLMMLGEMASISKLPLLADKLKELASTPQQSNPVQDTALQLDMAHKQSEISKNNATAMKYQAEAFETQIEAENASYGL